MAVVVLASATGSPGVTTTSLGLCFAWPRDTVLVDADRDAGQAVLAGFLRGHDAGGRGLTRLVDFESASTPGALLDQCVQLAHDPYFRRLFLPGFTRPSSAVTFEPVWPSFAHGLQRLDDVGCDALVDAGRIHTGLPRGLVDAADHVLVVVRATLRSLAAARVHLDPLADLTAERQIGHGLIVIGAGQPYTAEEISDQFGWPVHAAIPDDPNAAKVLSDAITYRKYPTSALHRCLTSSAAALAARIRAQAMMS